MQITTHPRRETHADRTDRQAAYFRELAELNMAAARNAATRIQQATAADASTTAATLDLARATRAVAQAVNAENALFRPDKHTEPPPRAPAGDTRRAPLREALHRCAKAEPDRAARTALGRQIDAGIERSLLDDPDANTSLNKHFATLAEALHLTVDVTKLSDEILGLKSRKYPQPGAQPRPADTADPKANPFSEPLRSPSR